MKKKSKLPPQVGSSAIGAIPNSVANFKDQATYYFLSFKFYNKKLCEIDLLEKNKPKECIHVLKRISQTTLGNLRKENVDSIPIANAGEYKKLYNHLNLTNEVQIFEHKVSGDSRLFYFTAAHEFYIVAITNNHFETNKVRR